MIRPEPGPFGDIFRPDRPVEIELERYQRSQAAHVVQSSPSVDAAELRLISALLEARRSLSYDDAWAAVVTPLTQDQAGRFDPETWRDSFESAWTRLFRFIECLRVEDEIARAQDGLKALQAYEPDRADALRRLLRL